MNPCIKKIESQKWCVGVAIFAASYFYDKLFSYATSKPISCGCRVVIPFGKSNVKRIGIVLSCDLLEKTDLQLKQILFVVDETPILSNELLELVFWLKEMTFCTYYDAVKTILPVGMQVQLIEEIRLSDTASNAENVLSEQELNFYHRLCMAKTKREFRQLLNQVDKSVVDTLITNNFLIRHETVKERTRRQNGTAILRLVTNILTTTKLTQTQQKLVNVLLKAGDTSEKEACYLSGVSTSTVKKLVTKGVIEKYTKSPPLYPYVTLEQTENPMNLQLTSEQDMVYNQVVDTLKNGVHYFLLHGVTGSGKTSVFIRLIDTVIKQNKQVILLVPEIALTPQIVEHFYRYFGSWVAVIHSELSLGQRSETWRKIDSGIVKIIIGTRSAIFAPVRNLGLVVIDEEGERTYKSDLSPHYHAISVAKKRCQYHNCPLLLASATPSIESYYYAERGFYTLLEMKHRYNQSPLPEVEVVDMQRERSVGNDGMFSEKLTLALQENLQNGNQSLLLLNRRGYHTIINCASCNQPIYCPNCSVPMTYHKVNDRLMCHYCGHTQDLMQSCPACGSKHLRQMGFGTQLVEEELQRIVPNARILRMDADTTMSRSAYEERFSAFRNGEYDIMLGTQMIGKGLDFPRVTLVGVLSVDKALYAGDFRSYERTFSLVTQVVGRSGRGTLKGRAILQTSMPDHYVIRLAAQQAYEAFYKQEIILRRQLIFPPICDIYVIGFTGMEEQSVQTASKIATQILKQEIQNQHFFYPIWVLEPVPCVYGKINGKYRYQLILKCKNTKPYRDLIRTVLTKFNADKRCTRVYIYADMNGDIGV